MLKNNTIRKTLITMVCCLVIGIVFLGGIIGSQKASAATASPSHSASTTNRVTASTLPFKVTSIDVSVTPSNVGLWTCGSSIQVVYNAVFHVNSGPKGGTIVFAYTVNNGRSQMAEKLTILPGQRLSNFVFTWQGSLPSDHFYPEPGGILVSSPNALVSKLVAPAGQCR